MGMDGGSYVRANVYVTSGRGRERNSELEVVQYGSRVEGERASADGGFKISGVIV